MIALPWLVWGALGCSSYAPDEAALDALVSSETVTVTEGDTIRFEPAEPLAGPGFIFYPGGLVQPEAYAPPLRMMAEAGVVVELVPMPSDLAVLAPRKANTVLADAPDMAWVIGGHSLGGAMAAAFADGAPDAIVGLALWAAYPPAGRDLRDSGLEVITVVATEDEVLDQEVWQERLSLLPLDKRQAAIAGGNHAGFGSYGPQEGDGEATISAASQHVAVADLMLDWWPTAESR